METACAQRTRKRTLPRVRPHVVVQVALSDEARIALVALVRFVARVNAHVCLKVASLGKALPASLAQVRLVTCVRSHVNFEPTRSRVGLFTVRALVRQFSRV
jgi:hypothetical protein